MPGGNYRAASPGKVRGFALQHPLYGARTRKGDYIWKIRSVKNDMTFGASAAAGGVFFHFGREL
jgi:hypothetical protein